MADPNQIRPFSAFVNEEKIATGSTHDYDWDANRELQFADGTVFTTEGVQTTEFTTDNLVPFGGDTALRTLEDAHLNGDSVQISLGPINGRIHKITMKATKFTYKSEFKNGSQMANAKFIGGKPTIVEI